MKHYLTVIFGLVALFSGAQEIAIVNKTAAILREVPKGEELMRLPYGTELRILNKENSWYNVEVAPNISKGYIHESVISIDSLVRTDFDERKEVAINIPHNGFEDSYVTMEHDAPETFYTPEYYRKYNEGLERKLYWNEKEKMIKEYVYLLDVMAERTKYGVYGNTPASVFNQLKSYSISNEVYNNANVSKPFQREFKKPDIQNSFFSYKPEEFLIKSLVSDLNTSPDEINTDSYARTTLIHLLRLYFENGNTFTISKQDGEFVYASEQRIEFFTSDEKGGNVLKNSGVITYYPGEFGRISITQLEKSNNANVQLLYFMPEELMHKHLENRIEITPTKKTFGDGGWAKCNVYEFDFNSDGIVDMLRSFEACPDEAGDSNDEVYYFNVNGKWESSLINRSWCNP